MTSFSTHLLRKHPWERAFTSFENQQKKLGGGTKLSKEKLQSVKLKYLGHLVTDKGLFLNSDRIQGILTSPTPKTKRQLGGFLDLVRYCRSWIQNFSVRAQPLYSLLRKSPSHGQRNPMSSSMKQKAAFMLCLLQNILIINCPFSFLSVKEREMPSFAVLTQRRESQHRPLGCCRLQLDLVSKGLPSFGESHCGPCQSTAACRRFHNGLPLALYVPHPMEALLNSHHTQQLSVSRLTSYEVPLLSLSKVTMAHCNPLLLSFLCLPVKLLPTA